VRVAARSAGGATLIELVAAIVIIAIAVLGLSLVVAGVVARSADPLIERQAGAIAESYLEEAMLASFCDPDFVLPGQTCRDQCLSRACSTGACGGTGALHEASRALYDDVCDYAGIDDDGARDRDGDPIAGLGAYRVRVAVIDAGVSMGAPALDADAGQVVRVDVRVTHAGLGRDVELSAFRANAR
jgi:MSHA pilin protein MshD